MDIMKEFQARKFGMFIHWGAYAVLGGRYKGEVMTEIGEWAQSYFRIPNEEYAQIAATFNPEKFDADEWMRKASAAGIKYIVFTSKHHDGFCMYDTAYSDYSIVKHTKFGRDPLKELQHACEKYGIKLGIYYSQYLDWHEEHGGDPGDSHTKNVAGMSWGNDWDFPHTDQKDFEIFFRNKVVPQVTELLTNYGTIWEFWFDTPIAQEAKYSRELRDLVKKLQPQCLINSRIGHGCQDFIGLGDNWMRHGKMDLVIEAAGTLNHTWGFKFDDHDWLKPEQVINTLVSLTENNANYLMNVGPMPDGTFTPETDHILQQIANWIADKKDAIHDTEQSPFPQILPDAYSTVKENRLNLFLRNEMESMQLAGINTKIIAGSVPFRQDDSGNVTLDLKNVSGLLPLVTLDFDGKPEISQTLTVQNGSMHLFMDSGIYTPDTPPYVLYDGTAGDWKKPEGAIRWEVEFPAAGTFDVLLKVQTGYLEPWSGNRVMALALDETQEVSADLNNGEDTPNAYCTIRTVKLGTFHITEPGRKLLTLRTLSIGDDAAANLRMTSLILIRR